MTLETTQCQQQVEASLREIEQTENTLKQAETNYQQAKKAYAQRDEVQTLCQELERLLQLKELSEKLEQAKKNSRQHQQQLVQLQEKQEKIQQERQTAEQQVEVAEAGQEQSQRLTEAYAWFTREQDLLLQKKQESQKLSTLQQEMEGLRSERSTKLADHQHLAQAADWPSLFTSLEEELAQLQQQEESLKKQQQQALVHQKLSEFAGELKTGEACPLCGSPEHPQPNHAHQDDSVLAKLSDQMQHLQRRQKSLNELRYTLSDLKNNFKHITQNLKQQQNQVENWVRQHEAHQQQFNWPELEGKTAQEVNELREAARKKQQRYHQLQEQCKQLRRQEAELSTQLNQLQQQAGTQAKEEHRLEGQYESFLAELSEKTRGWLSHTRSQISQNLLKGRQQYQQLEQQWQQAQHKQQQAALAHQQAQTRHDEAYKNLNRFKEKTAALEETLKQRCRQYSFLNCEQVETILEQALDTEKEIQEVEGYFQSLRDKESYWRNQKLQLQNQPYQAEAHAKLKSELAEADQKLENLKEDRTRLQEQLKRQESQLKQKHELEGEQEKLQIRLDNLKEMARLFKGQGFVDFASGHYLELLCRSANERFFRLTHNNLSLELDEKHNFVVRDYLNGGRTRLLKTLSGGQSFQAALCLALAMTEYIKSLTGAQQSFFFLDEGFGSLDKDSLRIVFDTLKSLRHENRIVGIISHVEELQQEIDLFLQVENDKEKGSLVSCSWEMAG